MWSSVTPLASHISFTMNPNWSGSSFPMPLNKGNFTEFTMLNCDGGGGGVGKVEGDGGEVGGDVGGGGSHRNPCFMN